MRDALALAVAVAVVGVSFGALAAAAGIPMPITIAMSLLVFAGGAQFLAVAWSPRAGARSRPWRAACC